MFEPLTPEAAARLLAVLRQIYDRPQPPVPWRDGGNLPWDVPAFSERMLREHLDQNHDAASRRIPEIRAQVQVMMGWLGLQPGDRLFDVTCGPGLYAQEFAERGVAVTGVDFGPASVAYARELCAGLPCEFHLKDVREMDFAGEGFDAAIYLYGQFTVLRPAEAADVLRRIRAALRPGAGCCSKSWTTSGSTSATAVGGTPIAGDCGTTFPTCTWVSAPGAPNSGPRSSVFTSST
jgi:SAM-dependent methyltransferase